MFLYIFNSFSGSTELVDSSRRMISFSSAKRSARERARRCFWPPDRLTPFSFIMEFSPWGKALITDLNTAILVALSMFFALKVSPSVRFSLMLAEKISGS